MKKAKAIIHELKALVSTRGVNIYFHAFLRVCRCTELRSYHVHPDCSADEIAADVETNSVVVVVVDNHDDDADGDLDSRRIASRLRRFYY
jgi:hypothetical protein